MKILKHHGSLDNNFLKISSKFTQKKEQMEKEMDEYLYDEEVIHQITRLKNTFVSCSKELLETGTFHNLKNCINNCDLQTVKLSGIAQSQYELRCQLLEMRTKIKDFAKESKRIIRQRERLLEILHGRLQEVKAKAPMETRYWSRNVELAAVEEAVRHSVEESALSTTIARSEQDTANDGRTQSEVNVWLLNHNALLEAQIEYMGEKRNSSVAALQKLYKDLFTRRNEQLGKLTALIYEYKKVDAVVEEHKKQMEEKREEEEMQKTLDNATTMVQAWWRSMMVTHKINPLKDRKSKKSTKKRNLSPNK